MTVTQIGREYRMLWRAGRVVPAQITAALDACDGGPLQGPQVDLDCGAQEPDVDNWEAGLLYPSWEQLQRLARLTGFPIRFFFRDHPGLSGPIFFMCNRSRPSQSVVLYPEPPILTFTPEALAARFTPTPGALW